MPRLDHGSGKAELSRLKMPATPTIFRVDTRFFLSNLHIGTITAQRDVALAPQRFRCVSLLAYVECP